MPTMNRTKYYEWFREGSLMIMSGIPKASMPQNMHRAYDLLRHPRNANIKKKPWAGYVMGTNTKMSGITKPLQRLFYPYQKSATTGGAKTGGSARGNVTDSELASLINKGAMPSERFSVYTERTLAYLYKHKLKPVAAQFLVYDERMRLATELDLVCIDLARPVTNNVVNIQLKTGFDKNYDTACGRFLSPSKRPDSMIAKIQTSHKTKHQLQVLVEHMMVQINYDRALAKSSVIVMSEDVVSMYDVNAELYDAKYEIYDEICNRKTDYELDLDGVHAAEEARAVMQVFGEGRTNKNTKM